MEHDRLLIVNADDFGRSSGVNSGIAEAFEHGIVTSASLMVRWPAARDAVDFALAHPAMSLGLHLDLCEWEFVSDTWRPVYETVPSNDVAATAAEVRRQLERFRELAGRDPTHLDSHQHVHRSEPVRSIVMELARELGVPLRECTGGVRYIGSFHGQSGKGEPLPECISIEALFRVLHALPAGVSELGCHPGRGTDPDSPYNAERLVETRTLCDPRIRAALEAEGITLTTFAEF